MSKVASKIKIVKKRIGNKDVDFDGIIPSTTKSRKDIFKEEKSILHMSSINKSLDNDNNNNDIIDNNFDLSSRSRAKSNLNI